MKSSNKKMEIGLVITQKNELSILNHNIEYHRYMGVSHFYIFDDSSSDRSMDSVADIEGVYKFYKTDFSNIPEVMESIKQRAIKGNWIGRQIINTYKALQLAKQHGLEWLIFIDADELIYLGKKENSIQSFFREIESDFDVVHFSNVLEAMPIRGETDNIFKSATYFKTLSYNDQYERKVFDPISEEMFTLRGFSGHSNGKQAARVNADLHPISSHIFRNQNLDKPKAIKAGQVLHYHGSCFADFMKQNSIRHPIHFIFGLEVPYYPKLFWKNLVLDSGMSIKELKEYYEKWLILSDEDISNLLKQSLHGEPKLIEFSEVHEVWDKIAENSVNKNYG